MVKPPVRRLGAVARRRQILDSALPVFARLGCAGAGTRQLAAAAGISEPVLYRHFRTKERLFCAVLDDAAGRLSAALAPAAAAPTVRAQVQALTAALPGLLDRHADDLRVLCGAAAGRVDAATTRTVRRAFTLLGQRLTATLGGGGLRRGLAAEHAAFFLLELGLGAALLRPSGVPAVMRPAFGEQAAALLLAALLP